MMTAGCNGLEAVAHICVIDDANRSRAVCPRLTEFTAAAIAAIDR